MSRRLAVRLLAGVAMTGSLLAIWAGLEGALFLDLTVAGITLGSIYALSGIGLVITYRASGVFNFAHGAIAMFVAYVLWQLVRGWGLPLVLAAVLAILVVGPGVGALLARHVFKPLEERDASPVEELVATVGVFILLVGLAVAMWGPETKTDPVALFSARPLGAGLQLSVDQAAVLVVAVAFSGALYWLLEHTRIGLRIRAVVEHRELAQLNAVDADQVSMIGWAIGAGLAGLTGVLLAPSTFGLDPFHLTLLVAETFAVAAIARLESLSLALVGGLVLGLATSYATQFSFGATAAALGSSVGLSEALRRYLDPVLTSLPVVALFGALFVHRRFAGQDRGWGLTQSEPERGVATIALRAVDVGVVALLLAAPFVLGPGMERRVQDMLALAVVFVSIVIVTGIGGHLTLGQAAFAGFGAFLTGRLVAGSTPLPGMPVLPAMALAVLVCVLLGIIVGYPALRRRGLIFGLTTFAIGLVLERFVFGNYALIAGAATLDIRRPSLFGASLDGDVAFHFYALTMLGLSLVAAIALRRGRLGRTLAAMRDSVPAARAVGVRVRRYTLLLFVVSTALAGLGGSLLAQAARTFSPQRFGTFDSFIWFAAVVVAGVTSLRGALLAAAALTVLSGVAGDSGIVIFLIGLGALVVGRIPGGVVGAAQRALSPAPIGTRFRPDPRLRPSERALELLRASAARGSRPGGGT